MKSFFTLLILSIITLGGLRAQTTLIDPAGAGGFELGTTFAANGWSFDNGAAVNTWNLGTVPPGFTNRCAFASQDAGITWAYTNTSTSVVHFWRDVTFPAGQSVITLTFNWQALGETSSFDALMVSLAPTSYTPTASTTSLGTNVLAAPAVNLAQLWNVGAVQTANITIPASLVGNCAAPVTLRLIFTWKNDGSLGTSPPAAIDNISLVSALPPAPLAAGAYTVGPTGTYPTLTAASADVNSRGVSGPVIFELQSTYTSAGETFPITLAGQNSCSPLTSVNTATIRPEAGAPLLSIAGNNAGPTIDLNAGKWWRIDGQPGGVGATKGLVISNNSTTGNAIRYINDASNNIVRFCDIQGVNTSTIQGVVFFSTGVSTGNDFNLIDNCDVHDLAGTTPANLITSVGTTTTPFNFNSNNTVSNCNLYNWFISTTTSIGVFLSTGSTEWTISGNSFYQTTARTLAAAQFSAINITATTSNFFTVSNNFIGGSAPLCGSGAMTLTGAGNFRAVNMTVGSGTSQVIGNTIQNINLTTTNATNFNGGLLLGTGTFNVIGNTIGSLTANNSIVVTSNAGSAFVFNGIILGGTTPVGTSTIISNNIGGISLTVTGAPATPGLIRGIAVQGTATNHNYSITGNTVGSTTLANSITADGNVAGSVLGIVSFSNAFGQVISGNTVSNLTGTNAGTANILWGILGQGSTNVGSYNVSGNTVQNLTLGTGNTANVSLVGIQLSTSATTTAASTISNNVVRNLLQSNTAVGATAGGLVVSVPTVVGPSLVNGNVIHSLNSASTVNAGAMVGIFMAAGNSNVANNMIRLGLDGTGAGITSGIGFYGIQEAAGNSNFYFNSVYVGGSGVATGASNTFGLLSTVTTGTRNYFNNILYNARSNAGSTGKHYAISLGGTAPNPAGASSNYNDLLANGTGGFIGLFNAVDQTTLANWRTATGFDFQSVSGDPQYINPTGNSATVDLHINSGIATVVESAGQPIPGWDSDFDNQNRAGLTPTDIGADAGNFILSDVAPPGIGYTPLISGCGTGDYTLAGVNITDGTGIPLAGALIPRIYYRKNAGAWFSRPGTLASGGATNSNWNFTIVVADMGGVAAGDIVNYYVIAQDNLGNVGSNPGGVVATDVNTVTTHPAVPNAITVQAALSGTYTVGAGGNYATLTAAIADYNARCIAGPIVFSLTDPTYAGETFPITINSNAAASSVNTLTIKPAPGVNASMSGTSSTALIVLNGADWVTIDGSNGNTANTVCPPSAATRNLTLTNTNTSTTSAVIWLQSITSTPNGASNNRVINCNLVGSGPAATLCGVGSGSSTLGTASLGTNNSFNSFINNNISNAQYGVISQGNSATLKNQGNTINQNLMNTAAPSNLGVGGVFVTYENGVVISGNVISEINRTSSPDGVGINVGFLHSGIGATTFNANECTNATITNNIIGSVTNSGSFSSVGIAMAATYSGVSTIANNMISGVSANGTASDLGAGILLGGGTGAINVFYNTVSMQGTITGASGASVASICFGVTNNAPPSALTLRNNIFSNTQNGNTGATQRYAAIGLGYTSVAGNYIGLSSNNNDLFAAGSGPGAGYAVGIVGGIAAGPLRTTLANWQTETGRDLNSFNVQPNFTSASDLHLITTANQCLDGGGASVSITTDIDCQNRNATTPDIGADEFTNPNLTLTVTENSGLAANDNITCAGATVTLTATGGGTYQWSTGATTATITPAPIATTTYTVTVTNGTCTDVMSTTITVLPVPGLSTTLTQPTTCVSTDGAIDLTIAPAGSYTIDWADIAGTNNPEDRTGLIVGTYNVTVTNTASGCTSSLSINLTGPGGCDVCPTVPLLTANPSPVCVNANDVLTASSLTNMGNTYGIIFKSYAGPTGDPYTGGTVLATVPNANLTSAGTVATATVTFPTAGNIFVYAILTPTPIDPACRPFAGIPLGINALPTAGTTVAETSGTTNNDGIICAGASATITGTGGTSYAWSTGANTAAITVTPAITQTYTVTVTNANGCTAVAMRTITVNPLPQTFNITGGGGYCVGGIGVNLGLSGSQVGVSYQLRINGVNINPPYAGDGTPLNFGTFTQVGTVTVIATTVATGCSTTISTPAVSVFSFNCNVSITDPCVCKNNATNLTNGQFDETIKINAPSNQTWSVHAVTGLYLPTSPQPPLAPLPVPPGYVLTNLGAGMNMFELKGIHIDALGYSVTVTNNNGTFLTIGNSCSYPNPSFVSDLTGDICLFTDPITLEGNPGDNNIVSAGFTINGQPATVFDPSAGVGAYLIEYTVNGGVPKAAGPNDPGCIQKISTTVHVIETPAVLNCNDLIYVSVDVDCTGEVKPDDVLEGTYGCFDDYLVELDRSAPMGNGPWTSSTLDANDVGKTYQVRVTHKVSGNKCWGNVTVQDKIVPLLTCKDVHLICPISTYDPTYLVNNLGLSDSYPSVDECSSYTLTYVDTWFDLACTGVINGQHDVSSYVTRKWTATDEWGNSSTCLQYLYFDRLHVSDVFMPADYTVACGPNVSTDPSVTGSPYFEAYNRKWYINPTIGTCELQSGYVDQVLPVCDGTYKILRTWTVIDWCLPTSQTPPFTNPLYYLQVITVMDNSGPAMTCPPNLSVSVDPFDCCATVDMPDRIIKDNCSRVNNIEGMVTTFDPYTGQQTGMHTFGGTLADFPGNNWWDLDTLGKWGYTPCLPIGTHTVVYRAQDDCSNVSTCSFKLTVADYIPPVAACDQETVVGIGYDDPADCYTPADGCDGAGVTWVKATTFNDGSYDRCNNLKFTIRRMSPYSDCINNLSHDACYPNGSSEYDLAIAESDSIKFYCCEVGTTQTVILRVYQVDVNGNVTNGPDGAPLFNECMIQVDVQDKIKPFCQSPANVTVTCEQFDPSLWLYGKAAILDNCCLDKSKEYQGQCGLQHSVSYTNFDTLCNKGTIVRTFRAFDCHGLSSQCTQRIVVTYEQDYYVKFPNDVIVTDCDGTGTYGEPSFYGEDCELLGVSYEDEIFTVVPDACFKIERNWKIINWCTYNPNAVPLCINVPNPNPNAIANHSSNLAGPIVSPIQTPNDPWKSTIVKINPTDALATNYSIYYDPNANCYTYKQIIKIIDNQDPVVTCPASPVTICDNTTNDPQLWNAMYWWDNGNQSHDLCEAPTEICLTATDLCSGSNINFEYQLFLDLDGDGTMETVVNSTQLGSQPGGLGWNNVLYNNLNGGGVSRQFDFRPVAGNQKWGFALQETVTGTNKTACVKFNTQAAQNSFVPAQLPHGTHKIKWFVTDGCGNETICEYTIIVKDCKAPTVVCRNGLSVNIMPGGMITLWATDFLQYAEDNCTLTPYLKYSIRKCDPNASGFPVDGNGNPITNVTFDCTELGTQCVELWSIDLAGNADRCETYVIVQDNNHNCGTSGTVTVSGALKTEPAGGSEFIEEVLVEASVQDAANNSTVLSNLSVDGTYAFDNVPLNSNVVVTPSKDDNPLNGVTTYDLVLISKHILGIEPLNTPYKMIAADANKSNSITTFDIVEIRKLILGIYQELPSNTSWRFVDQSFVFPNPLNPFQSVFPENKSTTNIQSPLVQDFVGVKIGDVNNTVVANSLMANDDRNAGVLLLDVENRDVKAGEVFEVTFKASDKTQGYQMTLNLNGLTVLDLPSGDKVNASNFGVFADALTVSVDGAESFTVKFRADKDGKLSGMMSVSSRITKAEAYSLTDSRLDVALRFDGKTVAGVGFELYQNEPNPFVNKTFIGFHLPEATTATLTVYDETGRVVFTQKGEYPKGYNYITLERALLNSTGVLYYSLETATDAATKKMIQTK